MKYKVNDIVNVNTYELKLIGKIISIYNNRYGFKSIIVKNSYNKLFEICEEDIAFKVN